MRPIIFVCFAAACGPWGPHPSQEPHLALVCDARVMSVDADEGVALGFTADEAMAVIEGTTEGDVGIAEEGRTVMALTVMMADGPIRFIDRFDPYTGDESVDCVDELEVPVTLMLSTDDGSFDFEVDATLRAAAMDAYSVSADVSLDANIGAYGVQAPGPQITAQHFTFAHAVNADSGTGQLSLFEEGADGQAVWATVDAIMTWPIRDE